MRGATAVAAVGAMVVAAAGGAWAQAVPAEAGAAGEARVEVRAAAGADRYVVNLTHAGGTARCETPCSVSVVPGDVRLVATGAAGFEQVLSVGGPSTLTLHRRSDLLFFGGLVMAALGVAGTVVALALNPAEGSNEVWAAGLGIGGIVFAGVGFTAVANAGSAGAGVTATGSSSRQVGSRFGFAVVPLPTGGAAALLRF